MARKAPKGRPAWLPGWVYTLHLDPPYPDPPLENGHQVGHYTGISRNGLKGRLTTHAEGGPDAARLLQVQKAAGGTFHLVSVEWGTQDTETARKYRGASWRCSHCKAGPPVPGERPAEMGWVCIVHLDPPGQAARPGPEGAQPAHCAVFIADTEALYAALGRAGRDVALVAQLPEARGGTWRLAKAEWAAADRAARLTQGRAAIACPVCRAAKEEASADELLAAIQRGEVAERFFARSGSWAARWHTRNGQPVVSAHPGGHLGRNVTRVAAALVRRGLAKQAPALPADAGEQAQPAGRPYQLTRAGQAALLRVQARRLRAAGFPVTRTGRLWLSRMTDEQRAEAGQMTRAMAAEHNALRHLEFYDSCCGPLLGPVCAGAARPDSGEDCAHDSCGGILSGAGCSHHPRRAQHIRGMPPADEWTTPAPIPARVATMTPLKNVRPLRAVTDPSWPSTISDGIQAAAAAAGPARRAASSRRAALTLTRGAAR